MYIEYTYLIYNIVFLLSSSHPRQTSLFYTTHLPQRQNNFPKLPSPPFTPCHTDKHLLKCIYIHFLRFKNKTKHIKKNPTTKAGKYRPRKLLTAIFLSPLKTSKIRSLSEILNPCGILCKINDCFWKSIPHICGKNFSRNILMLQARLDMRGKGNDTTVL